MLADNPETNFAEIHSYRDDLVEELRREIERLRAALRGAVVHMSYDYPGDAMEECGMWCDLCKEHVEDDRIAGHAPGCLLCVEVQNAG